MNPCAESNRFYFVIHRDGKAAALEWAKRTRITYVMACLNGRKKHGHHFPYRKEYLEAAFSLKYLYRSYSK